MDWHLATAARTIWLEAGDQAEQGQRAIAHVIANRVRSARWGKSLFEVCLSEFEGIFQFSCWARGNARDIAQACAIDDDDPQLKRLAGFVIDALHFAEDPTGGATHYYNPAIVKEPTWVKGDPSKGIPPATYCCRIGAHLFFRNVR